MKRIVVLLLAALPFVLGFAQSDVREIRERDLAQLIYCFNSPIEGIRESSVSIAGRYKITQLADHIENLFLTDSSDDVRKTALHTLYILKGKDAADVYLKSATEEKDPMIRLLSCEYYRRVTGVNLLADRQK